MKSVLVMACALAAATLLPATGHADTLTTPRDATRPVGTMPVRGMSMAQVERHFGAPAGKLPTAGGDTARHPLIHRWRYDGYTVYFERNRVLHSVPDAAAVTTGS